MGKVFTVMNAFDENRLKEYCLLSIVLIQQSDWLTDRLTDWLLSLYSRYLENHTVYFNVQILSTSKNDLHRSRPASCTSANPSDMVALCPILAKARRRTLLPECSVRTGLVAAEEEEAKFLSHISCIYLQESFKITTHVIPFQPGEQVQFPEIWSHLAPFLHGHTDAHFTP